MNKHVLLIILLLTMCGCSSQATRQPEATNPAQTSPAQVYGEASSLTALVERGELPPIEERLPKNPMIIEPVETVGRYGGTWHMGLKGYNDFGLLRRTIAYEPLVRWNPEWTRVIPNVVQAFEINDDNTVYTFYLRHGMRWSDGAPVVADNILFFYEDIRLNEDYNPNQWIPTWLRSGEEPAVLEKIDDYTVRFRFAAPHGLFLQYLAHPDAHWMIGPSHYLQTFHPSYNPEEIETLVTEAGVENWVALYKQKNSVRNNPEMPTLNAWILPNGYPSEGVEEVVAVRNPYYWKVDTNLNQLPYIDEIVFQVREDEQALVALAREGFIDMQAEHINAQANLADFETHMEQGDYRFFRMTPSYSARNAVSLNLTHADKDLREIFQNKAFRIALSHAIDRQAIIDQVYGGMGEPYQVAPRPESPFFHERLARQYTEFDLVLAEQMLDQAGYQNRDTDNFRLAPSGERINFTILFGDWNDSPEIKAMDAVKNAWISLGIDVDIELVDWGTLEQRRSANEFDAVGLTAGGLDVLMAPFRFIPTEPGKVNYAVAWAQWYKHGLDHPSAEVPPQAVQQQLALYDELKTTSDPEEQAALMHRILDIAADQFYNIGINLTPESYGIVKNNFRNVPTVMPESWTYPSPAPTNPCQYFVSQPSH